VVADHSVRWTGYIGGDTAGLSLLLLFGFFVQHYRRLINNGRTFTASRASCCSQVHLIISHNSIKYSYSPSHAHEEELPGTVNLQALEGDDTAYGQALYPVPSEDPNDPLLWSNSKKTMILIIVSLYSFLGNSALVGPSVYLEIYAEEFGITVTEASGLVSYPNLVFGFGSLLLVPAYLKFGRRPILLLSLLMVRLALAHVFIIY
jgi:hypothetical protein